MSSYECQRRLRRAAILGSLALVFGLALNGCGFRPLYGEDDEGSTTFEDLETVQIAAVGGRTGQQLHNLLRDRINPRGQPNRPEYVLKISLSEQTEVLAIQQDEIATRANLRLSARFTLTKLKDNAVVFRGLSNSINSYNIVDSQYATYVSGNDARERALRELSEDIRLRLATYFAR